MRSLVAAAVLLCAPVFAAQVRFQNFTGTNLVITNAARQLTLPPGELAINLEAGDWGTGAAPSWTLAPVDETVVVRYGLDDLGGQVVDFGLEPNLLENTFQGFISGLTVFGFAWMVSVIAQGLKVGLSRVD